MPRVTLAAVQTSPVYLDAMATARKAADLIGEAARHGAQVIAFPEAFVAGYPYSAWLNPPLQSDDWFVRFQKAAITLPGPELEVVAEAAKAANAVVILGCNETEATRHGSLFNSNVILGPDGAMLSKHRKLVPTHAEKMVWGRGDGRGLAPVETPYGRIGTLLCGENTNTLARFALLAQGEQIHVANFPAFPFTAWYEEADAIRIRCRAHAFEGKLFVIAVTSTIDDALLADVCPTAELRAAMEAKQHALSAVYGPDGRAIGDELIDDEGIVYASVELDDLIAPKQMHDITGHYNQFDVLSLTLDRTAREPLIVRESGSTAEGGTEGRHEAGPGKETLE